MKNPFNQENLANLNCVAKIDPHHLFKTHVKRAHWSFDQAIILLSSPSHQLIYYPSFHSPSFFFLLLLEFKIYHSISFFFFCKFTIIIIIHSISLSMFQNKHQEHTQVCVREFRR